MLISIFLNFIYAIALLFALPFLLYRMIVKGKYWQTLGQRLGFVHLKNADIWLHGVSVGEINTARPLIRHLLKNFPNQKIVISSTSSGGLETAKNLYSSHEVISFPLDFSWVVKKYLKQLKPKLVILMELELWPNFLIATKKLDIPVVLVNGRISDRSFKRYCLVKWGFRWATDNIRHFCVQTKDYAKRLNALGIVEKRIEITGNLKLDAANPTEILLQKEVLGQKLGISSKDTVIIAGSTHAPEERFILASFAELKTEFANLRLVIVPRHPKRAKEVVAYTQEYGFDSITTSAIENSIEENIVKNTQIVVGDMMGQLEALYTVADVVFIGGSLIPHGGQNFIEAASLSKAVICGMHMHNFPDIRLFLEESAIIQLSSQKELTSSIRTLLQDPQKTKNIGEKAGILTQQHRGSVQKHCKICLTLLRTTNER